MVSHWDLGLNNFHQAGWSASTEIPLSLPSLHWDYKCMPPRIALDQNQVWGLNSGPHILIYSYFFPTLVATFKIKSLKQISSLSVSCFLVQVPIEVKDQQFFSLASYLFRPNSEDSFIRYIIVVTHTNSFCLDCLVHLYFFQKQLFQMQHLFFLLIK